MRNEDRAGQRVARNLGVQSSIYFRSGKIRVKQTRGVRTPQPLALEIQFP